MLEQAAGTGLERLGQLSVRVFDAAGAFRMLPGIASVNQAECSAQLEIEYEMTNGSSVTVRFDGKIEEAQSLRGFLEPQVTASASSRTEARFVMRFSEGLATSGEDADQLAERLARFAPGAAEVTGSERSEE